MLRQRRQTSEQFFYRVEPLLNNDLRGRAYEVLESRLWFSLSNPLYDELERNLRTFIEHGAE